MTNFAAVRARTTGTAAAPGSSVARAMQLTHTGKSEMTAAEPR